jgi:hypothetical protein
MWKEPNKSLKKDKRSSESQQRQMGESTGNEYFIVWESEAQ